MIIKKLQNTLQSKEMLEKHFLEDITEHDRYLRFGYNASDSNIKEYLARALKDYSKRNMWFVAIAGDRIVAACHVAKSDSTAELGLSVSSDYRGHGLGQDIFSRGILWAKSYGVKSVFMQCLSENKAVQHIAKKNNMVVVTSGPDSEASIKIESSPFTSAMADAIMDNIAVYDSSLKNQEYILNRIFNLFNPFFKE